LINLKAIAVVDEKWGIGKDGDLLVHLPGDLRFFKEQTLNNIVIMGRATLESLPGGKPLPDRISIVMTGNKDLEGDFYTVSSIDELSDLLDELVGEDHELMPFVAGGESIYEQLMPYTETCIITKMDKTFDADKHFPNLESVESSFELNMIGDVHSENGVDYRVCEYSRKIEE
jgi:dihydrofolate reductase